MLKLVLAGSAAALLLMAGCAGTSDRQRPPDGVAEGISESAAKSAAGAAAATGTPAANTTGYLWSQRMDKQKRQMEVATQGTGVTVRQTAGNELLLVIPSDASFEIGRAVLKPSFAPLLGQFAAGLRDDPNVAVRIVGHTDSTGTDAIADPLAFQRAAALRDDLVARGVKPGGLRIEGRGSHEPVADNGTADGRARNRRVEIYVAERRPQS